MAGRGGRILRLERIGRVATAFVKKCVGALCSREPTKNWHRRGGRMAMQESNHLLATAFE
jgi:hypothetical protein